MSNKSHTLHILTASEPQQRTTSTIAFTAVFETMFETEREIIVDSYWLKITSLNGALLLVELY
jgi:hypothetical protein